MHSGKQERAEKEFGVILKLQAFGPKSNHQSINIVTWVFTHMDHAIISNTYFFKLKTTLR